MESIYSAINQKASNINTKTKKISETQNIKRKNETKNKAKLNEKDGRRI